MEDSLGTDMTQSPVNSFPLKSVLILIIILAVAFRIWGISFSLPNIYHVDEARFADVSIKYFTGDLNPHFFHVPSMNSYLVAGIWGVYYLTGKIFGKFHSTSEFIGFFEKNPTPYMILGRLFSALLGIATILVLFHLGKKMYSARAGAIAALFLIFSPVHNKISHYLVPDGPMVFYLALGFLFIWLIYEKGDTKYYVLAGLFAGFATATKSGGQMLFVPLILAHIFHLKEKKKPFLAIVFNPKLVLSGAVFFAAFFAGCPYALLDFTKFWKDFRWQSQHLYQTGHFGSSTAQPAWLFYLIYGFKENIGLLSQFLVLGGVLLGLIRHRKKDLILLSFPLVMFFLIGTWKTMAVRYLLPLVPFFILLGASFLDTLFLRAAPYLTRLNRKISVFGEQKGIIVWAVCLFFLFPPAIQVIRFDIMLTQIDTRTIAKEWVEKNIPKNARIALEMYGPPISRSDYDITYRHTLSGINMDWLSRRKIEYVIISDIMYARFTRYPREFPNQANFYNSLDKKAALIKTFQPKWDEYLIDLHNPTLKIYRLSDYPNFQFPGNFSQYSQRIDFIKTGSKKWKLWSVLAFKGPVENSEKVKNPYITIMDQDNSEVIRLFLHKGEVKSANSLIHTGTSESFTLPVNAKIIIGYEYDFSPNSPYSQVEKIPKKEYLLEEGIEESTLLKKNEFHYFFFYNEIPDARGDDYFQAVTLSRPQAMWKLSSEIFGGELRWGNDYVLNPFVEVTDNAGNTIQTLTLFKGKVGSYREAQKKAAVKKTIQFPSLPASFKVFIGYEYYFDEDFPEKAGGPERIELKVPL